VLALSTAWYEDESAPVSESMKAGIEAGFGAIELGVSPNPKDIESIEELVESGKADIVSVHNIFPPQPDITYPDRGDGLGSLDDALREKAIEDTVATVRFAEKLGAKAVIIHAGEIEIEEAKETNRRLCDRITEGGLTGPLKSEIRDLLRERKELARPHLERATESLTAVLQYPSTVSLGIESRYYYHQIPALDELELLLSELDSDRVFYWHDMGHAGMSEFFGVCRHEEWLERYADRMLGIHLHDMVGCADHRPPGSGELDFEMVKKHLSPSTIKVLEINHTHGMEEILEGIRFLKEIGIE
jgi:sugar phosphate isomerase/epimerase